MKKFTLLFLLVSSFFAFGQDNTTTAPATTPAADNGNAQQPNPDQLATTTQGPGYTDPQNVQGTNPNEKLQEIVLSKFESFYNWRVKLSPDVGYVSLRKIPGGPELKNPTPNEQYKINEADEYVMGIKAEYVKRTLEPIVIKAEKPLVAPGVVKTAQVWVAGRGFKNKLSILIQDIKGEQFKIYMGDLSFLGWKKLTATIPDNLQQINKTNGLTEGIKIVGFQIDPDPSQATGTQYYYFDDLRVTTDLYLEFNKDPDDIADNW